MVVIQRDGADYILEVFSEPPLIYLDHWALRLFSSDPDLRNRFLTIFKTRGTLMMSLMNVVEIAGNVSESTAAELRSFLEEIGPHWVPSTIDPIRIIEAEQGVPTDVHPCISKGFLTEPKFAKRLVEGAVNLTHVVDLTRGDEGKEQRESTSKSSQKLLGHLENWRKIHASRPKALDTEYPKLPFDEERPMRPIYHGLVRYTITDSFALNENHVRDLYHTIAAVRCADMVLLDPHWLGQTRKLKLPEGFVLLYGRSEIEQFLKDFETKYNPTR